MKKPVAALTAKLGAAASAPRDALRLGLPVGALLVGRPDAGPDTGLLLLAGLLLAVAAAGALVLGAAVRRAVHA